jgi:DNA-binding transcriptional LysR family regulator
MLRSHEAIVVSALAALATRFPRLQVDATRMSSLEQWHALRERQIDVGIGYGRPDGGELAHEPLADISVGSVLLPANHPLATRSPLHFRDLDGFPLLIFPRDVNPLLHDWLIGGLEARGLQPRTRPWMHSHAAHEAAVRAGHGWMLATEGLPESPEGVAIRPVADAPISTALSVWWPAATDEPAVQAFVETALAARAHA